MGCPLELVELLEFQFSEDRLDRLLRTGPKLHGEPEDAPADEAVEGDEFDEAFGGAELGLLHLAARFEDLVEHLDLPAQGIPVEFFDGVRPGVDGEVGEELPDDGLTSCGRAAFHGVDDGEGEGRVGFALADGWQHRKRRP